MSVIERLEVLDHGVLRFLTAGSVDDGKSTLIGRLLYDTKAILADQLAAIERTSQRRGQALDLSLLTDGLTAEREQGITIDVAYRYFATALRKFIIADAPGHEQYTRNMVTAASTAQLAIVLVDARHGVVTQTRRHATLAHLVGIPHLVVAVNKMDLVDYREDAYAAHRRRLPRLRRAHRHRGRPLRADVGAERRHGRRPRREPVVVRRPDAAADPGNRRSAADAGRGAVPLPRPVRRAADRDHAARLHGPRRSGLDRRRRCRDRAAIGPDDAHPRHPDLGRRTGARRCCTTPSRWCSTTRSTSRAATCWCDTGTAPDVARALDATLCWFGETPLDARRPYLLRHTTREVRAKIARIDHLWNVSTQEAEPAPPRCG